MYRRRFILMSTTMLSGLALGSAAGLAADLPLYTKAPVSSSAWLPAVDGVNGKAEVFGGSLANRSLYGTRGAISLPLAQQFGFQLDGALGRYDQKRVGAVAAHGFWRDPNRGLVGLYGSYTNWNQAGGLHVGQYGIEGAAYIGRWTVEGIAGVESGNQRSINWGPFIQTWDIKTRFFDKLDVAYYVTDDWKVAIGHRYTGGYNAAAFNTEYAFNPGIASNMRMSVFAEGRLGEADYKGIMGGVKFYFGQRDKSLMARHRQDDPPISVPETLFSIVNNRSNFFTPVIAPPPPPPCSEFCGGG